MNWKLAFRCLLPAALCSLAAAAPTALRWTVEGSRPAPADWTIFQGETVLLEPAFASYGDTLPLTNCTAALYWQTNGMDAAWWTVPAEIVTAATPRVRATWAPTNDCGAARYSYFISLSASGGLSYRAYGRLTMRPSPGATPNALPLPARMIDFAAITVTNVPWATPGDLLSLSNALAGAGSGPVGTNAWQNPASAAYWTWTSDGNEVTLTGYSGPDDVAIPDLLDGLPVTGLGSALSGRVSIATVVGGANIRNLGDMAFAACANLLSCSLPAVTSVTYQAFMGCTRLHTVALPAAVSLGDYVFEGDDALTGVYWGARTAPAIGDSIFASIPAAQVTNYVMDAHATGWGATLGGMPVVRAASMVDVALATNALVQTYLLGTNAWMTISNQTLTISRAIDGVETSLWSSAESGGGGDTFDMAFINALWTALGGKADKAWGQYAPDGSANPDPAYMTYLNSPATMHASGFAWATSGAFSVLAQSGTVAFESGADGEARWGLDLHTNYVAFVRGSNVVVGASAGGIAVADGEATIVYAYTGGDFPVLWFAPSLDTPFTVQSGVVWVDNEDGTATVTAPAETPAGFWYASTTALIDVVFDVRPPARLSGGVFGAPGALPVVYDSVIEIESGGKTYRIPAQEVP